MTPHPYLRLTTVDTEETVRIELRGDLDYDNADDLLVAVSTQLERHPGMRDLHLHCGGLGGIDSMGLSVLLMIQRRAGAAGVRLHLDDRPAGLERLLTITGSLEYLTAPAPDSASPDADGAPVTGAEVTTTRSTGPQGG